MRGIEILVTITRCGYGNYMALWELGVGTKAEMWRCEWCMVTDNEFEDVRTHHIHKWWIIRFVLQSFMHVLCVYAHPPIPWSETNRQHTNIHMVMWGHVGMQWCVPNHRPLSRPPCIHCLQFTYGAFTTMYIMTGLLLLWQQCWYVQIIHVQSICNSVCNTTCLQWSLHIKCGCHISKRASLSLAPNNSKTLQSTFIMQPTWGPVKANYNCMAHR